MTGQAMGLLASFYHSLFVRPPTDLVFVVFGLLMQSVALSLIGSSLFRCDLWLARVAARRLPGAASADRFTGL